MEPTKYRKKPVVVEAVRLPHTDRITAEDIAIAEWCGGTPIADEGKWTGIGVLFIQTPEGRLYAQHGDWIIRGVRGEFYPCKPDIFAVTYEPVEEE